MALAPLWAASSAIQLHRASPSRRPASFSVLFNSARQRNAAASHDRLGVGVADARRQHQRILTHTIRLLGAVEPDPSAGDFRTDHAADRVLHARRHRVARHRWTTIRIFCAVLVIAGCSRSRPAASCMPSCSAVDRGREGVLVTGAYGLIGSACLARLHAAGHDVVGGGRSIAAARPRFPYAQWIEADFLRLQDAAAWQPLLADIDAVVNCVGVLQDGLARRCAAYPAGRDRWRCSTVARAPDVRRIVHVSAIGRRGRPVRRGFHAPKPRPKHTCRRWRSIG